MDVLEKFLSDSNIKTEESFCKTFSENPHVKLYFQHDNRAWTNGMMIHSDPQFLEIYDNVLVLMRVEELLKTGEKFSTNTWLALKTVTRALSLHECLHILYTDFSINVPNDVKCRNSKNKAFVLHEIFNIVEDAFIEAYGASVYENIPGFLKFIRAAVAYSSESEPVKIKDKKAKNILEYLNYMTDFMLYRPFSKRENQNPEISEYIDKTKRLFWDGSVQKTCKKRYEFARRIFDIIHPLIPDDEVIIEELPEAETLSKKSVSSNIYRNCNHPKTADKEITRRLFTDLDGNPIDEDNEDFLLALIDFEDFEDSEKDENGDVKVVETEIVFPANFNFRNIVKHREIRIEQNRYKADLSFKDRYDEVLERNKSVVSNYKSKIFDLLQAETTLIGNKYLFGEGISSKRLGDVKRRFWYKKEHGKEIPPLSVLFLIDGSGSMSGGRIKNAITASVIIHEVLAFNGIEHCFAEHRAGFDEPYIDVNILTDFNFRPSQKYNLMKMKAGGDNRDSLALMWAERYLNLCASNENKFIVIISDGLPAHEFDKYYPPLSVMDTALTVSKILQRGTKIAAVALDYENSYSTYDNLKQIYPYLVSCNNLERLPALLFKIIVKMIEK